MVGKYIFPFHKLSFHFVDFFFFALLSFLVWCSSTCLCFFWLCFWCHMKENYSKSTYLYWLTVYQTAWLLWSWFTSLWDCERMEALFLLCLTLDFYVSPRDLVVWFPLCDVAKFYSQACCTISLQQIYELEMQGLLRARRWRAPSSGEGA